MNKEEQTYFKSFQGRAGFIIVFYGAVTRAGFVAGGVSR